MPHAILTKEKYQKDKKKRKPNPKYDVTCLIPKHKKQKEKKRNKRRLVLPFA
jgi:hypothetical protein